MAPSTINVVLDIVLVLAGILMVWLARGVGGIMGRTLAFIVVGALITGSAHLIATLTTGWFKAADTLSADGATVAGANYDGSVHRVIVLVGFIFLVIGFRQLQAMKR